MKQKNTISPNMTTTTREKIFYAMGDFGNNFVWGLIGSFLTLYYTDSVGLAAGVMGTMMLIARIFDGGSDILMGLLIEKTHSKWGKARPWVFAMSIPFAISVILLFNVPAGLTEHARNIYIFLTYFFLTVICYTGVDLAYLAMLPRISLDQHDRTATSTVRSIFSTAAYMILAVIVPMILEKCGGQNSQHAWSMVAYVFAIIAFICLLVCVLGVKEKMIDDEVKEKIPLKKSLQVLAKNRYFYILGGIFVAFYVANGVAGGAAYYVKDVLGNFNYYIAFSLASTFSIIASVPFAPKFLDKFGRRRGLIMGLSLSIVGSVIWMTNPRNIVLAFASVIIRSIGTAPLSVALFTLSGDIVDYTDWKNGVRTEGFVTAVNSFGIKVGTGLGSALIGWLLEWGGYNGLAETQTAAAQTSMIIFTVVIPCLIYIICIVLFFFWDIDKYRPEIVKYLSINRENGEEL